MARRAMSSTTTSRTAASANCQAPDSEPYWSSSVPRARTTLAQATMPAMPVAAAATRAAVPPRASTRKIQGSARSRWTGRETRFGSRPEKTSQTWNPTLAAASVGFGAKDARAACRVRGGGQRRPSGTAMRAST